MDKLKKIIVRIFPDIVHDRETSRKAISSLNGKLKAAEKDARYWRKRALDTERFLRVQTRDQDTLAKKFDTEEYVNIGCRSVRKYHGITN